jgi:cytochrome c oxidase subunit 3
MIESRSGLIAGLAGITMLFAAFTSAYVVRRGISADWVSLRLPGSAYISVLPLAGASIALGVARRNGSVVLLLISAVLGAIVCVIQLCTWRQIDNSGPAAAFYFVISAAFLLFVTGGVVALVRLISRRSRDARTAPAHFYYWVYLSALWIYVLLYLTFWN